MSLLTICQNVLRETGFNNLTSIASSSDENARRLFGLCNREGKTLMRAHPWTILQKEHTFSTSNGTANYALPSDFSRFVPVTGWNRTNYWALRGPISPERWQRIKSGVTTTSVQDGYRIKPSSQTNYIYLDPTPSATESIVFEYISTQWCQTSGGSALSAFASDTDVGIGDFEFLIELGLKWRFLASLGMAYAEERDEYDREVALAKARDGDQPTLSLNGSRHIEGANFPESGFG